MNRVVQDYEEHVYIGGVCSAIANGRKYLIKGKDCLWEEVKRRQSSFVGFPNKRETILKIRMKRVFKNR